MLKKMFATKSKASSQSSATSPVESTGPSAPPTQKKEPMARQIPSFTNTWTDDQVRTINCCAAELFYQNNSHAGQLLKALVKQDVARPLHAMLNFEAHLNVGDIPPAGRMAEITKAFQGGEILYEYAEISLAVRLAVVRVQHMGYTKEHASNEVLVLIQKLYGLIQGNPLFGDPMKKMAESLDNMFIELAI